MTDFDRLVSSRKQWIDDVLIPWCQKAPVKQLMRAEREWMDIAGKVAPEMTLWLWAWSRFPALISEGLSGLDETYQVRVTLRDGTQHVGYPDARQSERGRLYLAGSDGDSGPMSVDDIQSVEQVTA
ncbi:MAG: hypothetical protein KDA93_02935 [Planctomycetaceae bacterium]|nr:hypothetical protein [Planctomycetaceae bacterium]